MKRREGDDFVLVMTKIMWSLEVQLNWWMILVNSYTNSYWQSNVKIIYLFDYLCT